MKYVKGFIAAYFYYILLMAILYFRNFGTNEITYALIFNAFIGVPLVLVGALIIELIIQTKTTKEVVLIGFIGFIYGISCSVLFSGGVDLDFLVLLSAGLFSCFGFFIYLYFSRRKSYW